MGEVELARSQAHLCQLLIYKGKAKGRHEINRYGKPQSAQQESRPSSARAMDFGEQSTGWPQARP